MKKFAINCAGHGPLKWDKKNYLKLFGRFSDIGWYFFSKKRKTFFFWAFNTQGSLQMNTINWIIFYWLLRSSGAYWARKVLGPRLRSSGMYWASRVLGWGPALRTEMGRSQVEVQYWTRKVPGWSPTVRIQLWSCRRAWQSICKTKVEAEVDADTVEEKLEEETKEEEGNNFDKI